MVFNPTRLSISDLPQMPETVLKTCSKDFSQNPLFIQLLLFLPVDQLYWLGCHYQNHHTKFLLTLIKMHVLSMTKSVHFPCLCVQTASYIHTFLFLLNLLPQTEFIFCLAFYVRNTHHVIWVKQKSPLFLFPYTVWIEACVRSPASFEMGRLVVFFFFFCLHGDHFNPNRLSFRKI